MTADGGLLLEAVTVRFGSLTAVDGVSLRLPPGQTLALLGPSGCGKSTLLRAIAGLEPLAAGTVRWDGVDLAGLPVHRRDFGLVFQDGQLFAHLSVGRNVAYGLAMAGLPRSQRRARVSQLLELVGLAGYERRDIATLSGGQRQRVALARSLAPRPRLLLLDEPLASLDAGLRERLAADLRRILTESGTTALFVTHDRAEAFDVADRVAVMLSSQIVQTAPPADLWRYPASAEIAGFLGVRHILQVPVVGGLARTAIGEIALPPMASGGLEGPGGRGQRAGVIAPSSVDREGADQLGDRGRGVGTRTLPPMASGGLEGPGGAGQGVGVAASPSAAFEDADQSGRRDSGAGVSAQSVQIGLYPGAVRLVLRDLAELPGPARPTRDGFVTSLELPDIGKVEAAVDIEPDAPTGGAARLDARRLAWIG